MTNIFKNLFKAKELTPSASFKKMRELLKERKVMTNSDIIPGNIIVTFYNAKYPEFKYDRTPLILVLRRNSTHTLGLNFHWIDFKMRTFLIYQIMKLNQKNIAKNKPLQFSYHDLKPFLKKLGYAPCIRLYINKRIGPRGIVVPPDRLLEMAQLRTETFTNGKYSSLDLFKTVTKKYVKKGARKINKIVK